MVKKEEEMSGTKFVAATLVLFMLMIWGNASVLADATDTETSLPVITVSADGKPLEILTPNMVSLPAALTFRSSKPVTIFYTTNGTMPTSITSPHATISSVNGSAAGPTIYSWDYVLVTIGSDEADNLTPLMTYTFASP